MPHSVGLFFFFSFFWSQGWVRAPVVPRPPPASPPHLPRDTDRGIQLQYSTGELALSQERTRSDILYILLLLPREVHFLGKHSCQGHTAAIRHERASPKPIVSKTGKRQARICKGVPKVSFPGESEPWKIFDIEQFMIQCQHAVMERSI